MNNNKEAWVWSQYRAAIDENSTGKTSCTFDRTGHASIDDKSSVKIPIVILTSLIAGLFFPTIAYVASALILMLISWNIAEKQFREFVQPIPFKGQLFNALERMNEFLCS
jgi:hypothetical protein